MKYLIDTNIIIDHLRSDKKATDFIENIQAGKISGIISVITECELLSSSKISEEKKKQIGRLLDIIPKLSVTSKIARKAGGFRSKYQTLEIGDALIAANCYYAGAILVTRNLKHFQIIKEIKTERI